MSRKQLTVSVAIAACAGGAIASAAACGVTSKHAATPPREAKQNARIQRALDRLTASGAPGAVVLVRDGNRTLRLTSGYANLEKKTPMRATDRFRIGSVTKTFVAPDAAAG